MTHDSPSDYILSELHGSQVRKLLGDKLNEVLEVSKGPDVNVTSLSIKGIPMKVVLAVKVPKINLKKRLSIASAVKQ